MVQAKADAEKGLAAGGIQDRLIQVMLGDRRHAVPRRPLAGKQHPVRAQDHLGIVGDQDLVGGTRHVLDRLGHRAQVAHAIVDDADALAHRISTLW